MRERRRALLLRLLLVAPAVAAAAPAVTPSALPAAPHLNPNNLNANPANANAVETMDANWDANPTPNVWHKSAMAQANADPPPTSTKRHPPHVPPKYSPGPDGMWRRADSYTLVGSTVCDTCTTPTVSSTPSEDEVMENMPEGWVRTGVSSPQRTKITIALSVTLAVFIFLTLLRFHFRPGRKGPIADLEKRKWARIRGLSDAKAGTPTKGQTAKKWARATARWRDNARLLGRQRRVRRSQLAASASTTTLNASAATLAPNSSDDNTNISNTTPARTSLATPRRPSSPSTSSLASTSSLRSAASTSTISLAITPEPPAYPAQSSSAPHSNPHPQSQSPQGQRGASPARSTRSTRSARSTWDEPHLGANAEVPPAYPPPPPHSRSRPGMALALPPSSLAPPRTSRSGKEREVLDARGDALSPLDIDRADAEGDGEEAFPPYTPRADPDPFGEDGGAGYFGAPPQGGVAHVATDDKALLARLAAGSSRPPVSSGATIEPVRREAEGARAPEEEDVFESEFESDCEVLASSSPSPSTSASTSSPSCLPPPPPRSRSSLPPSSSLPPPPSLPPPGFSEKMALEREYASREAAASAVPVYPSAPAYAPSSSSSPPPRPSCPSRPPSFPSSSYAAPFEYGEGEPSAPRLSLAASAPPLEFGDEDEEAYGGYDEGEEASAPPLDLRDDEFVELELDEEAEGVLASPRPRLPDPSGEGEDEGDAAGAGEQAAKPKPVEPPKGRKPGGGEAHDTGWPASASAP
ncbi:hypothetical protein C8R45DRAFT_1066785 [Mycena sanguinolenta]|nr:hypothetical protein C8R45DRAFT_1066785 [Mycena sanguinolenta]